MKYEVKGGNLPVLLVYLEAGETIECEASAMSWMVLTTCANAASSPSLAEHCLTAVRYSALSTTSHWIPIRRNGASSCAILTSIATCCARSIPVCFTSRKAHTCAAWDGSILRSTCRRNLRADCSAEKDS